MSRFLAAMLLSVLASTAAAQSPPNDDAALVQRRNEVREMARDSLATLFEADPRIRLVIERAAGFGVFSSFGLKIFFAGGSAGKGIVVNNLTQRETFMKMIQVQAGLGLGAKKDRLIFVFETQQALRQFIDKGWEVGGQAGAAAMVTDRGGLLTGAVLVSPGVYLFQLTETGLSASITLGASKFFRDPDLN